MSMLTDRDNAQPQPITVYTTTWCPDCWRAKKVMESMNVSFVEVNISQDEDALATVEELNNGYRSVPTIVFPDGSILTEPSTTVLMNKLRTKM